MTNTTIPLQELFNFFGEADNVRRVTGQDCSFEIDHEKDHIVISWGANYELMRNDHSAVYPFNKNITVEVSPKGVVSLISSLGSKDYYLFTKTIKLRDFR
jgi:hypothetical protein